VNIGQAVAEIWYFFDFSMLRLPPSWILKIQSGQQLRDQFCTSMPNFMNIGQNIAEISQFCDFRDGGRCHLRFSTRSSAIA